MASSGNGSEKIIVDPARYELDAAWVKEASVWARMVARILEGVRHQTAAIGMLAIVAVLWMAGTRAQDTALLCVAIGSIATIAVSVEFIDGKNHDQHRGQGAAQSRDAAEDQAVD